jgi:hypothetical protein
LPLRSVSLTFTPFDVLPLLTYFYSRALQFAKQFQTGKVLAMISSRPGQSGRCDGYILEGEEFEFYRRKILSGKAKHAAQA